MIKRLVCRLCLGLSLFVGVAAFLPSCQSAAAPTRKGPQASSPTIPWDRPSARHSGGPLGSMLPRQN